MLRAIDTFDAVLDVSGFAYSDTFGTTSIALVEPLVERAVERVSATSAYLRLGGRSHDPK